MHKILAVLLWCSLSLPALAVQVTDLYTGQAQASGDVSAAQGEALGQVLLKLTGDKTVIAQPAVLQAMTTVSQLVRRYDYQTVDGNKMIRTEFEPAKVNDLLTRSQVPMLGASRPQLAMWLVIDDSQRRMVSDQSADGWAPLLRAQAQTLALPVALPIMDLDDSSAVSVTDVLGRFSAPVMSASARYGAEMVLLGRLTAQDETWTLEWSLYGAGSQGGDPGELTKGTLTGSQSEVSEQLMTTLSHWLVQKYGAKVSGERQAVSLSITGLGSMGDVAAVQTLLGGIASVSSVSLSELDGDKVTFALDVHGGADALSKGLALEPRLTQESAQDGGLHYRWVAGQSN